MKFTSIKLTVLCAVAWFAGVLAYLGALALFYDQSIGSADFTSILRSSAVGFALAFVLIYLPVLLCLRRVLGGVRPLWTFPLVAASLGVAPTALILLYWGGGFRSLLSHEASLFYAMFAVVGLIVGIGYARIHARVT